MDFTTYACAASTLAMQSVDSLCSTSVCDLGNSTELFSVSSHGANFLEAASSSSTPSSTSFTNIPSISSTLQVTDSQNETALPPPVRRRLRVISRRPGEKLQLHSRSEKIVTEPGSLSHMKAGATSVLLSDKPFTSFISSCTGGSLVNTTSTGLFSRGVPTINYGQGPINSPKHAVDEAFPNQNTEVNDSETVSVSSTSSTETNDHAQYRKLSSLRDSLCIETTSEKRMMSPTGEVSSNVNPAEYFTQQYLDTSEIVAEPLVNTVYLSCNENHAMHESVGGTCSDVGMHAQECAGSVVTSYPQFSTSFINELATNDFEHHSIISCKDVTFASATVSIPLSQFSESSLLPPKIFFPVVQSLSKPFSSLSPHSEVLPSSAQDEDLPYKSFSDNFSLQELEAIAIDGQSILKAPPVDLNLPADNPSPPRIYGPSLPPAMADHRRQIALSLATMRFKEKLLPASLPTTKFEIMHPSKVPDEDSDRVRQSDALYSTVESYEFCKNSYLSSKDQDFAYAPTDSAHSHSVSVPPSTSHDDVLQWQRCVLNECFSEIFSTSESFLKEINPISSGRPSSEIHGEESSNVYNESEKLISRFSDKTSKHLGNKEIIETIPVGEMWLPLLNETLDPFKIHEKVLWKQRLTYKEKVIYHNLVETLPKSGPWKGIEKSILKEELFETLEAYCNLPNCNYQYSYPIVRWSLEKRVGHSLQIPAVEKWIWKIMEFFNKIEV